MKFIQILCTILAIIAVGYFGIMELKFNILILKKIWIPIVIFIGIGLIGVLVNKNKDNKHDK